MAFEYERPWNKNAIDKIHQQRCHAELLIRNWYFFEKKTISKSNFNWDVLLTVILLSSVRILYILPMQSNQQHWYASKFYGLGCYQCSFFLIFGKTIKKLKRFFSKFSINSRRDERFSNLLFILQCSLGPNFVETVFCYPTVYSLLQHRKKGHD